MRFRKLFGYAGGQKNLIPLLRNLLIRHRAYVEIFGGGGTLLLNKELSTVEVYNDVNRKLVSIFLAVRDNPDEFERQISVLPNSREIFRRFKEDILTETDPMRLAVMQYYMLLNSWSGVTLSRYVAKERNVAKIGNIYWFSERMRHVIIENLDFEQLIEKYDAPDTLFFLDPPYVDITDLYEFSFKDEDHIRLAKVLRRIKGYFLMTYGAHPLVDILYKGFPMFDYETVKTMYKTEGGERDNESHTIVANYDIMSRSFKPFQANYVEF